MNQSNFTEIWRLGFPSCGLRNFRTDSFGGFGLLYLLTSLVFALGVGLSRVLGRGMQSGRSSHAKSSGSWQLSWCLVTMSWSFASQRRCINQDWSKRNLLSLDLLDILQFLTGRTAASIMVGITPGGYTCMDRSKSPQGKLASAELLTDDPALHCCRHHSRQYPK